MSFVKRKVDVQITLGATTFNDNNDTITIKGARCQATIDTLSGSAGSFNSQLQLMLYGMKPDDAAKLSTLGFSDGAFFNKNRLNLYAGDDDSGMALLFSGAIYAGAVDYNAMPDVGVSLICSPLADIQLTRIAATSYAGTMDVASMIQAIANTIGKKFINAGVTAKLRNHATGGSALDQINSICSAAGIHWALSNDDEIVIWPKGGTRDASVVNISAQTGMVGYPVYGPAGTIYVRTLMDPTLEIGRKVIVKSSVPNLTPAFQRAFNKTASVPGGNGEYYVWTMTHDISTVTPDGPWFTTLRLGDTSYVTAA